MITTSCKERKRAFGERGRERTKTGFHLIVYAHWHRGRTVAGPWEKEPLTAHWSATSHVSGQHEH